jgi:hypothetical protein
MASWKKEGMFSTKKLPFAGIAPAAIIRHVKPFLKKNTSEQAIYFTVPA